MAVAAAPIHRLSVEQSRRLVAAGLLADRRMELVDGILFDVVPANPPHSRTVSTLTRHLARVLPDDLELLVQEALFIHDGFISPDLFVAQRSRQAEERSDERAGLFAHRQVAGQSCRERQPRRRA